ncbi:hypothetical protein H6503_02930 [Candidatus Woesearchaeota archaeon]|nr:hypothetical protein [Candidatus Woesearchaeota archaeon]
MGVIHYLRQRTLPYLLAGGLAIGLLTGCKEVKTEYSEQLTIDGVVAAKVYKEEQYLNPSDDINPMNDIDPFFDMKKGRYATKQDEEFNVFINTGIGRYKIDSKRLFKLVEVNSPVKVTYRERFRSTYDDIDKDGEKELVERVSCGYKLLNVQPK